MITIQDSISERTRTFSADSGCDVHLEPLDLHSTSLENSVKRWQARLVKVVQQETTRAEEITQWATAALNNCEEDDFRGDKILEKWRKQMEGVIDFTQDLLESINNDTKDAIAETAKKLCLNQDILTELCLSSEQKIPLQNNEMGKEKHEKYPCCERSEELAELNSISLNLTENFPMHVGNAECFLSIENENYENYWNEKVSNEKLNILLLNEETKNADKSKFSSDIIFVNEGQEKDVLTNWNIWDKFGEIWNFDHEDIVDHVEKDHSIHCDIDIQEVFWKISLDVALNKQEPTLLELLKNLPVWESPDIFLDSSVETFNSNIEMKTEWNDSHKFGQPWIIADIVDDDDYPTKQVCVMKVFWKICLNKKLAIREPRHSSIIFNLPVFDWPGISMENWTKPLDENDEQNQSKQVDHIDDFTEFKHVFDEENQVAFENKMNGIRPNQEPKDWIHCKKFGKYWDNLPEDEESSHVACLKQNETSDVDVLSLFWEITLDESCCTKDKKYSELTTNFPAWFGPDVFEDCWDLSNISETLVVHQKKSNSKDPLNIFKSWRKIFSEFVNCQKMNRMKMKITSNSEEIFKDWFSNVVNGRASKRKFPSEQRYLPNHGSSIEKKQRRDPYVEMSKQEEKLLKLLENWRI